MKRILNDKQVTDAYSMYVNGMSTCKIAKRFNCSATTIQREFKEALFQIKDASHARIKFKIKEDFFDVIDTEEKAYFLGFLYADGNVSGNRIRLGLKSNDKEILEKFSNIIYGQNRVKTFKKSKDTSYIYMVNKHMVEAAYKYGLVPNKTFILKFPDLEKTLVKHFIRGYFDGDGGLSFSTEKTGYKRYNFDITSTYEMLEYIQILLRNQFNFHSQMRKRWKERHNNNYTLRVSGNNQINKICEWLYSDSNIYLKRKFEKYKELSLYSQRVRQKSGRKPKQ